jgi:hypothetical protein
MYASVVIIIISRDSSAEIVTCYGLDGRNSISGWSKKCFFFHRVQTGSGAYLASYPWIPAHSLG